MTGNGYGYVEYGNGNYVNGKCGAPSGSYAERSNELLGNFGNGGKGCNNGNTGGNMVSQYENGFGYGTPKRFNGNGNVGNGNSSQAHYSNGQLGNGNGNSSQAHYNNHRNGYHGNMPPFYPGPNVHIQSRSAPQGYGGNGTGSSGFANNGYVNQGKGSGNGYNGSYGKGYGGSSGNVNGNGLGVYAIGKGFGGNICNGSPSGSYAERSNESLGNNGNNGGGNVYKWCEYCGFRGLAHHKWCGRCSEQLPWIPFSPVQPQGQQQSHQQQSQQSTPQNVSPQSSPYTPKVLDASSFIRSDGGGLTQAFTNQFFVPDYSPLSQQYKTEMQWKHTAEYLNKLKVTSARIDIFAIFFRQAQAFVQEHGSVAWKDKKALYDKLMAEKSGEAPMQCSQPVQTPVPQETPFDLFAKLAALMPMQQQHLTEVWNQYTSSKGCPGTPPQVFQSDAAHETSVLDDSFDLPCQSQEEIIAFRAAQGEVFDEWEQRFEDETPVGAGCEVAVLGGGPLHVNIAVDDHDGEDVIVDKGDEKMEDENKRRRMRVKQRDPARADEASGPPRIAVRAPECSPLAEPKPKTKSKGKH